VRKAVGVGRRERKEYLRPTVRVVVVSGHDFGARAVLHEVEPEERACGQGEPAYRPGAVVAAEEHTPPRQGSRRVTRVAGQKIADAAIGAIDGEQSQLIVDAPATSTAPISTAAPWGQLMPRWSVAGAPVLVPASMAGLVAEGRWVRVGPPLLNRLPSCGS
jgi:hypothetical protein